MFKTNATSLLCSLLCTFSIQKFPLLMILCIGSFVEMCMDLEFAIQSEANQKEEKNGKDDPNFQGRKRDADTENRHVDTVRDGEGGRIGIDIYIPPCVK